MAQNVTLVRPDGSDTIASLAVDTDATAAERGLQVSFDPPPQRAMPPPPRPWPILHNHDTSFLRRSA